MSDGQIPGQRKKVMSYTYEDFQRVGKCGRSTMFNTFKLCGIPTRKDGEYTEEDLSRFKTARHMKKEERKSDREIADFFKVSLRSAEAEEEAAAYASVGAEEATDVAEMQVAETMVGIYKHSAKKLATAAPALAMRCLAEELASEEVRQQFAALRSQLETSGGSPTAFLLQMAQSHQLTPSKPSSISLPPASNDSSEPE